jgi:protein-disulfide isomerase
MRRYLPFIIVAVVGLLTIGSGAMLYRAKRPAVPTKVADQNLRPTTDSKGLHIRGERDAAVTLEEFGDFQCPPCGTLSPIIDEIERTYHSRLRIVFREFPLPMHTHAAEAAYTAEAAGLQGRFWEMHDLLYREQAVWSKATDVKTIFNSYVGMLGLDAGRFQADVQSAAVKERVERDHRDGMDRGVKSTPTVFINNRMLEPSSLNKAGLTDAIEAALKQSPGPKSK